MPKKDRAYSVRIPPQVWEGQKDRILALYKEHILCKVLEKITTTEFSPSESQLREKLKEWGSKKRLSAKERKKINREIETGRKDMSRICKDLQSWLQRYDLTIVDHSRE
ncbi:hypothetical protein J4E83_005752 [Alternaria metachromatica]|uniref:uncharacterized protein n=1 Tax=Alternaria metachromatica TaxID=283354 RepID=UPI0020C1F925|nr:uncharacterized protein J4E83_005752 [Alternaria metachromatica]KAI4619895.1 hypothetical protein J4E83_005752 [Alternaria metachromatica]